VYLERVVLGEERGFVSWVIRAAMWPLSVVYRIGLSVYLGLYSSGLRRRLQLNVPVVSVGNLTFGGTGKTPAVQAIARMLADSGKRCVVLSRGHGGSASGATIVSDGRCVLVDPSVCGDEPAMLAESLPGVPVIVGRDRRVTGRLACSGFSPDVIILDDGLQYWQLHRELDIIVLDATRPFGSGLLMPMGDLREPISGIARGGAFILTNSSRAADSELAGIRSLISRLVPDAPVFEANRKPVDLLLCSGELRAVESLRGVAVAAFCGIGRPEGFFDLVRDSGAEMIESVAFADHHWYTSDDIKRLSIIEAEAYITTEKDFARLNADALPPEFARKLHVLRITLEIQDGSRLAQYIADRIDR